MARWLTTTELALAIGASESSVRRWTNNGAIRTSRTAGGHRRISLSEAIRFVRSSGAVVVRPELLSLPRTDEGTPSTHGGPMPKEETLYQALIDGDAASVSGLILGMYLDGMGVAALFDGPLASALRRIGELWKHGPRGILVEHRATEICLRAVVQLRQVLPSPAGDAAAVVGGAPAGDPYVLPSLMAATVFADAGYRDTNFGANTPFGVLAQAAKEVSASLVWLAISCLPVGKEAELRRQFQELAATCSRQNATLLVGGRYASKLAGEKMPNVHIMETMSELAGYLRGSKSARRRN